MKVKQAFYHGATGIYYSFSLCQYSKVVDFIKICLFFLDWCRPKKKIFFSEAFFFTTLNCALSGIRKIL